MLCFRLLPACISLAQGLRRLKALPKFSFKRLLRKHMRWVWCFLALSTLVWAVFSQPAYAQSDQDESVQANPIRTAAVVVDGRPVFEIHGLENFTATERAASINAELQQEVKMSQLAEVRVDEQDNLVFLQSRFSRRILVTVTQADVTTALYDRKRQAKLWARELQAAIRRGQQERDPAYLRQATLYSAILLAGAIALSFLLQLVRRQGSRYLDRWLDYTTVYANWERPVKVFWQLGFLGLKVGLWLTVFLYVTDVFPQARSLRYTISNFLTADIIVLGSSRYSALELMLLLGLTVGLWFAAHALAQLFRMYVLNRASLDQRIQDILSASLQYALIFLGIIVLLQIWGIDSSSLAILASVLGVGIGFGVQNITNNFISGFIITLERPIQMGDFIDVGGLVGTVKRIGSRSTEIRTLDQVTIIVPNSRFLESEVVNWSHGNPVSRVRVPVGVAYGSDIAAVKTALLEAIKRHPEVLLRPRPEVWFQGFGDSSLNFEVMVWTGEPRKQFRVKSDLNYEIEASLRRHGVEIPFPQRDLHLRSPHLDELVNLLKQGASSNGGTEAHSSHARPESALPSTVPPHARPNGSSTSQTQSSAPLAPSTTISTQQDSPLDTDVLSNLDLEALAEAMQGEEGVDVRDHHYQSDVYPDCFTGTTAVEWLVQKRDYTREGAVLIGQWLLQKGLIHGVMNQHDFKDGYYFYQFYGDQPSELEEEGATSLESAPSSEDTTAVG